MKNIIVFLLTAVLAVAVTGDLSGQKKKGTETVVFTSNIHCDNCRQRIEQSLPFEKGVKDVIVDIEAKTITVVYDAAKTDVLKLRKAIEKLGYKAEPVKPEPAPVK